MTLHRRAWTACAAAIVLACSTVAAAQTGPTRHAWSHGTMLGVFAGAGHEGSRTGALAGGGIGWEVLPWFGLEGNGSWLDRGARAEAFAADVRASIGLPRAHMLAPFVAGGVGLYRATSAGASAVTDPSLLVGAGINVFLREHVALRPEVTSTFVMSDGGTRAVTAVVLRITYHFEDHPITPGRTSR